jgi:hypothetical protein
VKAWLAAKIVEEVRKIALELPPPGRDDLESDADVLLRPLREGTGIAVIRPDELQPWKSTFQGPQDQFRPRAIMPAGGMDNDVEPQPERIHHEMSFASPDFLAAIESSWPTLVGPYGLALDDRRTRGRIAARPLARQFSQLRMHLFPGALATNLAKIVLHRGPWSVLPWHVAPGAASADQIKQPSDDAPNIDRARSATRLSRRQKD